MLTNLTLIIACEWNGTAVDNQPMPKHYRQEFTKLVGFVDGGSKK